MPKDGELVSVHFVQLRFPGSCGERISGLSCNGNKAKPPLAKRPVHVDLSSYLRPVSQKLLALPAFVVSFAIPSSDILWKFSLYPWLVTDEASFAILTAIALDRYINIVYPLKAMTIASSLRKRVPFVAWCLALVFSLPVFFAYGASEVETKGPIPLKSNRTTPAWVSEMVDFGKAAFVTSICAGFLGPCLISMICYVRIGHVIWARRKKFPSSFSNQQKSKLKIVKISFTVLLLGELTWSPFAIGIVFDIFGEQNEVHTIYMSVTSGLLFFGGVIIPFVYAIISLEFPESFKEILCCKLFTDNLRFKQKVDSVQLKSVKVINGFTSNTAK